MQIVTSCSDVSQMSSAACARRCTVVVSGLEWCYYLNKARMRGDGGRGAYNEAFQSAGLGEGSCQTVYSLFVVIPSHDGVCMYVCKLNLYMQQQADLYIYIQSGH